MKDVLVGITVETHSVCASIIWSKPKQSRLSIAKSLEKWAYLLVCILLYLQLFLICQGFSCIQLQWDLVHCFSVWFLLFEPALRKRMKSLSFRHWVIWGLPLLDLLEYWARLSSGLSHACLTMEAWLLAGDSADAKQFGSDMYWPASGSCCYKVNF